MDRLINIIGILLGSFADAGRRAATSVCEDISDSLELYGGEEFLVLESLKKNAKGQGAVLCDMGRVVFLCGDTSLDRAEETARGIADRLKEEGGGEFKSEFD